MEQVAEFVVEFIHATGSVDRFLSTGVERMAQRANLDVEAVFFQSGFGDEFVPARAGNIDFVVIRMDVLFHVVSFRLSGHRDVPMLQTNWRLLIILFVCQEDITSTPDTVLEKIVIYRHDMRIC